MGLIIYPNIPSDNNGSEKVIRNIKVKLKVSGQFKSPEGVRDYATLKSLIDTARKRDMNVLKTIIGIFSGKPVF